MPFISAISIIDFPDKVPQTIVKEQVLELFSESFPQAERLGAAFENTEIKSRNFCKPLSYYTGSNSFEERNKEYIDTSLHYSVLAIYECIDKASVNKEDITDLVLVSTTGLATPSLDALIINEMKLNPHINRMPVWGLGCGGGVSGMAKANTLAIANPDAVVLFVTVELCSLTLIKNDFSKSNFIGSSLFSDGIAACIIKGNNHGRDQKIRYVASGSKLYYDTKEIMGWDFMNSGFKVLFSKDIPSFIQEHIQQDIADFLLKQSITLEDIRNFIFHPGGKKVLDSYASALNVPGDFLKNTRDVMADYGNMSSASVMYVLERFLNTGYEHGYGLMLAMGPGFSSELVLLEMNP